MCGIAGHVRSDAGTPPAELLERMCRALEHRGPDSRGLYLDHGVGLGIQRLRVIDLLTGDQPVFNEDRSVAVVLNGEIYNFQELREQLLRRGHRFSTSGDTEAIVHLYEEQGPDCVHSLHGMFGLAIWDARRRQLVLARDRLGKKPLFYFQSDGVLSFASELNALMQDASIPRDLDREALDAFLNYQYVPSPLSVYRAVRKLPPASRMVWRDGRAQVERYWRLDYRTKCTGSSAAERDEAIRDHIRRAVRRRLVADVPLGAFLSGGIDSSAVVAAMAEATDQVKTFSIGFESDRFNELPRARMVAERFATDHHEFVVTPDALEMLPRVVEQYGEPFGDSSAIPSFYVSELARRHVTVALNGDGGDESFAGYSHYFANVVLGRLDRIPSPARRALQAAAGRLPHDGRVDSPLNRLRRLNATLSLAPPERFYAYRSYLDGLDTRDLYSDDFRAATSASTPARFICEAWEDSQSDELLDRMLDVDINTYLPGQLLTKIDIATMAHSLEARSPLLDHELMQFAASLPTSDKVHRGHRKVAMRRALRGWVPDGVLDGPKQGFSVPLAEWFRDQLRDFAREVLLDSRARSRGYFREDAVAGLLDAHVAGRADNSRGIWTLLVLELWHQRFVDQPAVPVALGTAG